MTVTTLGDMARQHVLSQNLRRLKSDVTQFTQELSTGQRRDLARIAQGNMQHLANLDRVLAQSDARLGVLSILTVRLDAQQGAITAAQETVQQVADMLLRPELFGTDDRLSPIAKQVGQSFGAVVDFLNAQAGGRGLFSGQDTDKPALADGATMLADLALQIPAGADPSAINQIVGAWFAPGGGFEASGYLGGASESAFHDLGDGGTLRLGLTASHPAIRDTLATLAKGALMDAGLADVSAQTRRQVLTAAGVAARTNAPQLLLLNEDIGIAQARVEQAHTRQLAAQTAASIARTTLVGADPYDTATRLQDSIARVDQLFALTARLSRLSLSAYL